MAHVAERLFDLPHLAAALEAGELSFDKVRAVLDAATPENEAALAEAAKDCTVAELVQLTRAQKGPSEAEAAHTHETRSVRCNDTFRTVTAQLPPEAYAEVRAALEARAKQIGSDGQTRWDQRMADAFVDLVRAGSGVGAGPGPAPAQDQRMGQGRGLSPYLVVAHVRLGALLDEEGACSDLAGELERGGLLSAATLRRIACDATIVLGVDDDVGHTMYEGRARRSPSATQRREIARRDRHCRFPGCANVTFTNAHHVVGWTPGRGRTDLPNLALLCEHHHHLVHSSGWTVSGDANVELTFVGPTGRVMTSRPSPLWTAVTGAER